MKKIKKIIVKVYKFVISKLLNLWIVCLSNNKLCNYVIRKSLGGEDCMPNNQQDYHNKNTVYPFSDDVIELETYNEEVFVGIPNLRALDILSNCYNVKNIVFIDCNSDQVYYIKKVIEVIQSSNNSKDFKNKYIKQIDKIKLSNNKFEFENFAKNVFGGHRESYYDYLQDFSQRYCLNYLNGFLSSEQKFKQLKNNLLSSDVSYFNGELNRNNINALLTKNKYNSCIIWFSNIFNPYFFIRYPKLFLTSLYLGYFKRKFKVRMLMDDRVGLTHKLSRITRDLRHINTMSQVSDIIGEKLVVEIVANNEKKYVRKVRGTDFVSTYIMTDLSNKTVLFHLLVSHNEICEYELINLINKNLEKNNKVYVLESVNSFNKLTHVNVKKYHYIFNDGKVINVLIEVDNG